VLNLSVNKEPVVFKCDVKNGSKHCINNLYYYYVTIGTLTVIIDYNDNMDYDG